MFQSLRRLVTDIPRVHTLAFSSINNCRHSLVATVQTSRCFGLLTTARPFDLSAVSFLKPTVPSLMPSCGLKIRGKLKLRCKDCYKVVRDGRLYVECKTFGRHRQTTMKKSAKNSYILAHATQSKVRPW